MRRDLSFIAGCALILCGCHERSVAPVAAAAPAPAAIASAAPMVKATAIQAASVVRVRVAFGGLPPQDGIGAILRASEIPDRFLTRGGLRFVLVPLAGWTEAQLGSTEAHLMIYRNKVDETGQMVPQAFPAYLAQFDAETGLAILAYTDDFEYSMDAGVSLARNPPGPESQTLLRASWDPRDPIPIPNKTQRDIKPYAVDAGTQSAGTAIFAPMEPNRTAGSTVLALDGSDQLTGFEVVSPDGSITKETPLDHFTVAVRRPALDVANVAFTSDVPGQLGIILTATASVDAGAPGEIQLLVRRLDADLANKPPAPPSAGNYAPIGGTWVSLDSDGSGQWEGTIPFTGAAQSRFYLMQIAWPFIPTGPERSRQRHAETSDVFGKPFIVQVTPSPDGPQAALYSPPTPPGQAKAEASTGAPAVFHLEAGATEVHLIRGGREALFRLDQYPYWKLFSFEKDDWIPLPWNLNRSLITGNLDSIFVLDLDTYQLSKYAAPGLAPVATVTLPRAGYISLLAGCDTANAPVHVLTANNDGLSIDPQTLQRRDPIHPPPVSFPMSPDQAMEDGKPWHLISGDGLTIFSFGRLYNHEALHYNCDSRGLERSYLGVNIDNYGRAPGITGGFEIQDQLCCHDAPGGELRKEGTIAEPWASAPATLSENCPVSFRLIDSHQSGSALPRLGCFAFFSPIPFAEFDVPEYSGGPSRDGWQRQHWAFLDPYSRQVATLNPDRTTWLVRKLPDVSGDQPVLLNWPDTTVARGDALHFKPQISGGAAFTADIQDQLAPAAAPIVSGTLQLPISTTEFSSLRLLNFKVPGRDGSELSYPMLIHIAGPELPYATVPDGDPTGISANGTDLATLGASHGGDVAIPAASFHIPGPISDIAGRVGDYAVLVSATTNRVYFFSLTSHEIAGSIATPPGALFYPGSGALLEYDRGKQTLSRIRVPSGVVERMVPLPPETALTRIGVGSDPGSPITLVLTITHLQSWIRFAGIIITPYTISNAAGTITESSVENYCIVLDGATLGAGSRAQPVSLSDFLGPPDGPKVADYLWRMQGIDGMPSPMADSRNGTIVTLQNSFLALGRNYALVYPFAQPQSFGPSINVVSPAGSNSGLMAFTEDGQAYKAGVSTGSSPNPYLEMGPSSCGRYQFRHGEPKMNNGGYLDVRVAETGQPLIRIARLPFLDVNSTNPCYRRRLAMLGDEGPLAIIGGAGQTLELVDLDIPSAAKAVLPDLFHVTSQPVPMMMEGATMQYQVKVNNPAAVQGYHLQREIAGCTLSPTGLLTFTAPRKITAATNVTVSIEITGKDGQKILHEFPIYILPWPRPARITPANVM